MPHSVYPSGPKARIPPGACACSGRPFSNFSPTARPLCPAACGFFRPPGTGRPGRPLLCSTACGPTSDPKPPLPPSPGFAKGASPLAAGVRGPRRPPGSPLPPYCQTPRHRAQAWGSPRGPPPWPQGSGGRAGPRLLPFPRAQAPGSPLPRTHKQRTRRRQVLCLCSPFFHLRALAAGHPAGNQVPKPQAQPAQAQRQRIHVPIAEEQAVV